LGANLVISDVGPIIFPALSYSVLVLIGNPIIVMILMGFLRFKKRTSFLASVTVAQISEFSLIVVAMGASLGHVDQSHVALSVMIAVITMTASTYLILGAEKIYARLKDKLSIFERRGSRDLVVLEEADFSDHVVLVGCLRTGARLLPFFKKRNIDYLVVDFNPEVYKRLTADNHPVIFGDIADPEILDAAQIDKSRLVISTIDSEGDNEVLLDYIKKLTKKPISLFTSGTRANALKLYQLGADYVVVPEVVAGDHIRNLLRIYGTRNERLRKAGQSHFNRLIFT
jgi:voltage-gated potassium channel Kch